MYFIRRELEHPLYSYTKLIQSVLYLGSSLAPLHHRVHVALTNLRIAHWSNGDQNNESENDDNIFNRILSIEMLATVMSPNSKSQKKASGSTQMNSNVITSFFKSPVKSNQMQKSFQELLYSL